MRTHIDWLTFTLAPVWVSDIPAGGFDEAYLNALADGFINVFAQEVIETAFAGNWEKRQKSRAPYSDSWQLGEAGITVFASAALPHFTVEISGHGCEALIKQGTLNNVLTAVVGRITRLDVACDIETAVRPAEFVSALSHKRMSARGSQVSITGETEYVGSQKSERYARVYRYNPPHPRSHLLRVEHVFRKEYAKVVAQAIVNDGLENVAAAAGRAFGWQHETWRPDGTFDLDISVQQANRAGNNTLHWLIRSAAPAFKNLCAQGVVADPLAFLEAYFLPQE